MATNDAVTVIADMNFTFSEEQFAMEGGTPNSPSKT